MGARKIVDEQEVLRWFEEGRTYEWMSEEYRRKYNIETVPSLWSNFRHRRGLDRRSIRDDNLIPWSVKREHRWAYAVRMLRALARQRAGHELPELEKDRLASFLAELDGDNELGVPTVVHYDPEFKDGFVFVPREPGDTDVIRRPQRKTTQRRSRVEAVPPS